MRKNTKLTWHCTQQKIEFCPESILLVTSHCELTIRRMMAWRGTLHLQHYTWYSRVEEFDAKFCDRSPVPFPGCEWESNESAEANIVCCSRSVAGSGHRCSSAGSRAFQHVCKCVAFNVPRSNANILTDIPGELTAILYRSGSLRLTGVKLGLGHWSKSCLHRLGRQPPDHALGIGCPQHTEAWTKWLPSRRRQFSNAFNSNEIVILWVQFHWGLFHGVQCTISQHCSRLWVGAVKRWSMYNPSSPQPKLIWTLFRNIPTSREIFPTYVIFRLVFALSRSTRAFLGNKLVG